MGVAKMLNWLLTIAVLASSTTQVHAQSPQTPPAPSDAARALVGVWGLYPTRIATGAARSPSSSIPRRRAAS